MRGLQRFTKTNRGKKAQNFHFDSILDVLRWGERPAGLRRDERAFGVFHIRKVSAYTLRLPFLSLLSLSHKEMRIRQFYQPIQLSMYVSSSTKTALFYGFYALKL